MDIHAGRVHRRYRHYGSPAVPIHGQAGGLAGQIHAANAVRRKRLGDIRHGGDDGTCRVLAFRRVQYPPANAARRVPHAPALEFPPPDAEPVARLLSGRICRPRVRQSHADGAGRARRGDDRCRHGGVCAGVFFDLRPDSGGIGRLAARAVRAVDCVVCRHDENADAQTRQNRAGAGRRTQPDDGPHHRCLFQHRHREALFARRARS